MAAPQEGYPAQAYPPADPYAQQSPEQPGFDTTFPPPPSGHHEHEVGKKKKRGYAAQAYDFGAGANAALGGQPQGGGQFQPAQALAYGGYPQQQQQQQPELQPAYGAPQYGAQPGVPAPGAPVPGYGGGVGGYQVPDAGYPVPGAPAPAGISGITQGMGQMGIGGSTAPPAAQPQQAAVRPAVLNPLFTTDLLNQPFNVAELDLPPPPIILPPNVSFRLYL